MASEFPKFIYGNRSGDQFEFATKMDTFVQPGKTVKLACYKLCDHYRLESKTIVTRWRKRLVDPLR